MKLNFILILFLSLFYFQANSQETGVFREMENKAFKPGEKLVYRAYYQSFLTGKLTAGIATLRVLESPMVFDERETWQINVVANSKGFFNTFFKVRNKFDSYIDRKGLFPQFFIRRTREGGYKKDDEYKFNQKKNYVVTRSDSVAIPDYTQDFVSAVYYARSLDFDTLQKGDVIPINFFLDDSVYISAIIYQGKEIIEVELGSIRCLKFLPGMATGEVFADKYPMSLYVTDDKNHLPVLLESAVVVGSVKAELIEFEGLSNPMTSFIEKYE
ncbi:MAG: DUF3108 domain-containing protein [Chlorobi bacterium]|nr:DUF3108 domain-containing protein [Chlorobiota bacterium]